MLCYTEINIFIFARAIKCAEKESKMLQLKNIVKNYLSGDSEVRALCGIDLIFRRSEFVSVLGPSGCGKTTLLNIIGGLDRYSDGDLMIGGRSTKSFSDRDWDTYRNHSVGFVFQSYNLIPHQTVLSNVELALTLAGVSKAERRRRAKAALEKVGLGDQLNKRPAQMSGGQMQRVAIARALVNDPEIVLADEPTGALDSETSLQVMELLKEISRDRLVIMVTHNPELAERYSTRIVRLLDGRLVSDSDPCTEDDAVSGEKENAKPSDGKKTGKDKKPSMSFFTALSLSLQNLMTKRGRTVLTSFAGSIGIIGIALILSLSSGINAYIATVQEETLSSYPITLNRVVQDYTAIMSAMESARDQAQRETEPGVIYVDDTAGSMLNAMSSTYINDLASFKTYFEAHRGELDGAVSNVMYEYDYTMQIYSEDGLTRVSPTTGFEHMGDYFESLSAMMSSAANSMSLADMFNIFDCMQDNPELLQSQYEVVGGRWADGTYEMMLVLDENQSVSKMVTYILGINDQSEMEDMLNGVMSGEGYEQTEQTFSYSDFIDHTFRIVPNSAFYRKTEKTYTVDGVTYPVWEDVRTRTDYDQAAFVAEHGIDVTIVGIIKPGANAIAPSISGVFAYNTSLNDALRKTDAESEISRQQVNCPDYDVFSGVAFGSSKVTLEMMEAYVANMSDADLNRMIMAMSLFMDSSEPITRETLPAVLLSFLSTEEGKNMLGDAFITEATYNGNLSLLGYTDADNPTGILIYAVDFAGKDRVTELINDFNEGRSDDKQIRYTDLVGLLMSSITTIIDVISYVLIAFVSISLIVSSIMIGIITYISVLERTKEIGVLRAMGASKRDVSRVFNAETLIVGAFSGAMGLGVTVILCLPINALIRYLSGIGNIGAYLPWQGAIVLMAVSIFFTVIAGFLPARFAAKRDPVEALRSE